jgi:hypothetical protein
MLKINRSPATPNWKIGTKFVCLCGVCSWRLFILLLSHSRQMPEKCLVTAFLPIHHLQLSSRYRILHNVFGWYRAVNSVAPQINKLNQSSHLLMDLTNISTGLTDCKIISLFLNGMSSYFCVRSQGALSCCPFLHQE